MFLAPCYLRLRVLTALFLDSSDVGKVMSWLQQQPQLDSIDQKHSYHSEIPFYRTKVKLKKEIVTMGVEGIDPKQVVGTYVKQKIGMPLFLILM